MAGENSVLLYGSIFGIVFGIIAIAVALIIWAATNDTGVWFWILLILGCIVLGIAFIVLLYYLFVVRPKHKKMKEKGVHTKVTIPEY